MRNIIIATAVSGLLFSLATTSSFATDKKASSLRANAAKEYNASIDFVRTNIVILRKSMPKPKMDPVPPMPLQDDSIIRPVPENIEPEDPALAFDVEIRDGMSLYNQSGWFNLSSYSEKSGVMMVFARPDTKPIIRSTQYAPVDILFIDKQGTITQIAPSINLSEIEEDIYPSAPILAYLFVKGGTCANMHINVGADKIY